MPDYLDIPNPLSDLLRTVEQMALNKAKRELQRAGDAAVQYVTQPFRDAATTARSSARAIDNTGRSINAGVCAAPALAVSDSDWAGEAILDRYLTGRGNWTIVDDPKWTAYMAASPLLRNQVNEKLVEVVKNNAAALKPGSKTVIQAVFHAEVENGEGIVGYQYLHGTNKDAGDFAVQGNLHTLHVSAEGNVEFSASLRLTWNDMIDPNPIYATDTWKSRYAEGCTMGRAAAYRISITWKESRNIIWHPAGSFLTDK